MAFHDIRLDDDLSFGFKATAGFRTAVLQQASGHEERVARWNVERRRYSAAKDEFDHAAIHALYKFYLARKGALFAFRLKDWTDYATTPTGTLHNTGDAAVTHLDMALGTGDGTTTQFQLQAQYASGSQTHTRAITLPVSVTVKVGIDGVDQGAPGSGWTVNQTTGVVTFTTAPGVGAVLTWGGEFDVPVRFDQSADDAFEKTIGFHNVESILDIPLVEVLDSTSVPETTDYGGSFRDTNWTADLQVTLHTKVVALTPQSAGLSAYLPPPPAASGGIFFVFLNEDGTNSYTIRDDAGGSVDTVPANGQRHVALLDNGDGTKTWISYG